MFSAPRPGRGIAPCRYIHGQGAGLSLASIYSAKTWIANRAAAGDVLVMRSIVDLEHGACRWPVAEGDDGHLFCGERARPGKPYCGEHYALAYRPFVKAQPSRRFACEPVIGAPKTVELRRVLFRHSVR